MKNIRIFIQILAIQLFAFASAQIYQFTNCGASGRFGPVQAQCDSEYGSGVVTVVDGIQQWTVPSSGLYTVEVYGAQGAYSDEGFGAQMKGDIQLTQGEIIQILVGQKGGKNSGSQSSGGGGSFVVREFDTPLIIAGGGGNRNRENSGTNRSITDGTINNDGNSGFGSGQYANNEGQNGNGGTVGNNDSHGGGGGGGFYGDGQASTDNRGTCNPSQSIGALSFISGGIGGWGNMHNDGGACDSPERFGGFGGGASGGHYGAGAGGGYSGGGGDYNNTSDSYAGGGGSFIAEDGQLLAAESGINAGHGSVTITFLGPDLPDPITSIDITGTSGYRMLSSPVSGAVYGDLLDELWTQGMTGSDDPDNGGANAWTWNNNWNALTDLATDNYTAGSGVLVYVFADTDFDGTDNLPVTLTLNGTQNTSPVTIATNDDSWNLLGNPYGYALSIQQLAIDNAGYGAVYIWDNTTNAYKIHNGTTGDIADGLIAPFQGFWSRADAGAASYTFTESSISSDAGTNYRTTTDDIPGSAIFSFHLGDYTSSTYLSFTPEGHINLDQADASRLLPMSSMEHLTSMIHESGKSLSINNLPLELSNDISFPMDVMMLSPTEDGYETQAEQINLTWDVTNLPAGISLELKNNITGQNINLTGYPSANINLPSKGGFSMSEDFMATYPVVGDAYFTVSVNATLAGLGDDDIILPEQLVLHNAYPNPFNPSTLIRFDLLDANMVSLDIFDLNGKQVSSLINEYMIPGSHQINWNPGNLSSGIYLVNLVIGTETFNQKITFIK